MKSVLKQEMCVHLPKKATFDFLLVVASKDAWPETSNLQQRISRILSNLQYNTELCFQFLHCLDIAVGPHSERIAGQQ